ncbi:replication initiation protein [Sinorhizobium medicae]|uniref:Replication initiation protein n=1 Tax=Sinorhizobium medicae TaxID=110321 RepID=A0ABX4TAT0_9HYPH|nr:replication initiation protein [Sinorhizobium medicae]MDX0518106.1 replication initiation protein [Sinorhizobium medicae]MDX0568197.1 replication initiation protein [Sinorhizobium medicae]MDX0580823.1 replication initiation protein [Sinorhizobium medicae]MDX0728555.1 replication initiation protein [Sinorhizobium medicae]
MRKTLIECQATVRSMLGLSASAYQEDCAILGPENAAAVTARILKRAGHINSAGGYLRDLTRKAECGKFSRGRC